MAPLWKNMIESGKTQIIYCVDASAPERVGQAAINLIGKTLDRELGTKGDNKEPPGDRHTKIMVIMVARGRDSFLDRTP